MAVKRGHYGNKKSDKLKAAEMLFSRRLLRVSWTDKKDKLRGVFNKVYFIDITRLTYFGHDNHSTTTSLMSTVVLAKVVGKRRSVRSPMSYISSVVNTSSLKMPEMVLKRRDKKRWHDLTTSR